jgi:hypothetical protein
VRIAFDVREGVVFAMNRNPLARLDARCNPDDHAEQVASGSTKSESPVGKTSMEINGGGNIGHESDGDTDGGPNEYGLHDLTVTHLL